MKTYILFLFMISSLCSVGQTQTVNCLDSLGRKTGYWIDTSFTHDFVQRVVTLEKGFYINGLRCGVWVTTINNSIYEVATYSNQVLNGPFYIYNNGKILYECFYSEGIKMGICYIYSNSKIQLIYNFDNKVAIYQRNRYKDIDFFRKKRKYNRLFI